MTQMSGRSSTLYEWWPLRPAGCEKVGIVERADAGRPRDLDTLAERLGEADLVGNPGLDRLAEPALQGLDHREEAPHLIQPADLLDRDQVAPYLAKRRHLGQASHVRVVAKDVDITAARLEHPRAGGHLAELANIAPEPRTEQGVEPLQHQLGVLRDPLAEEPVAVAGVFRHRADDGTGVGEEVLDEAILGGVP
jgi:hypothetical protein